eukprot:TRINITY_DN5327_c0_g2_i1.p1 TRINITY_DN5327_c0_g2~~TRINITY_DN5327_c0_g2_i1.p1  ORF type:complete len:137 (+),score=55.98 TRINITY_DN5327_c0_g2_i1:660-1070(+)
MHNLNEAMSLLTKLEHLTPKLDIHLYDTTLGGIEMAVAALSQGVSRVTASVGGLGRHKYFGNLMGNVIASDLVFALDCLGIKHNVKWRELLEAERRAARWMKRENISDVFAIDFKEKLGEYREAIRVEMEKISFAE